MFALSRKPDFIFAFGGGIDSSVVVRLLHESGLFGLSGSSIDRNRPQKGWEVAQAPAKNFLMMGFMMWMAGSTVHLFSLGITFSALWQPISALQGVGKVFEPYKDKKVDLNGPKLLFIALNLVCLGVGVWKLNTLGLLPTHASDWVSSLPPAQEVEYSGGGIPFQ